MSTTLSVGTARARSRVGIVTDWRPSTSGSLRASRSPITASRRGCTTGLAGRAAALGWPASRVMVIDEDPGQRGPAGFDGPAAGLLPRDRQRPWTANPPVTTREVDKGRTAAERPRLSRSILGHADSRYNHSNKHKSCLQYWLRWRLIELQILFFS